MLTALLLSLAGLAGAATDTSTATATATSTSTATRTATASRTSTETLTHTRTSTASRTATESGTSTNSATATPTATATRTSTHSRTSTHTRTSSSTRTSSKTSSATSTSTRTSTISDTRTLTFTRTITVTFTGIFSVTATLTRTPTPAGGGSQMSIQEAVNVSANADRAWLQGTPVAVTGGGSFSFVAPVRTSTPTTGQANCNTSADLIFLYDSSYAEGSITHTGLDADGTPTSNAIYVGSDASVTTGTGDFIGPGSSKSLGGSAANQWYGITAAGSVKVTFHRDPRQ